jgi:hypothetical protein
MQVKSKVDLWVGIIIWVGIFIMAGTITLLQDQTTCF